MTTRALVNDRIHYLGTYGPRATKAELLDALTATTGALRAIIEAHECQDFDEWTCSAASEAACPVEIAAHHLGLEGDTTT
jgi:hypothetical protein